MSISKGLCIEMVNLLDMSISATLSSTSEYDRRNEETIVYGFLSILEFFW